MARTWARRGILVLSGAAVVVTSFAQSSMLGIVTLFVCGAMFGLLLLVRFGANLWTDEPGPGQGPPSPE